MTRRACAVLGMLLLANVVAAQFAQQGSKLVGARTDGVATAGVSAEANGCGESWQVVSPPPTSNSLLAITWTGSQFVAVGALGTILTSPDGLTWASHNRAPTSDLTGVTWTGGELVAVGTGATILTSPDGATWTSHNWGVPFDLMGIAWTATQAAAVGYGGTILASPDGATWTSRTSPTPNALFGVTWAGTRLVAVGQYGTILTSPDGVTWTLQSSGTQANLSSVARTASRFVVVGDNGAVMTSADGIAWASQTSGVSSQLKAVVWTGGRLVAVGAYGTILTSQDGINWSVQASGTSNRLSGIAWTGTQLVAVGVYGTILTSQCAAACSPPSITLQPQGQTVQSGQTATLSVVATGTAPLSYQWYQGASGDSSHPVGANGSSFITPAVTNITNYWVRISNACGHADSATATVSISVTLPSITSQPQSRTVRSGQTATLSVVATGTPPLSYEWYQGASGDTSQPVGTDANSFTTPALTVTTSYWVRVSNSGGYADSTTATVSISVTSPTITLQPQSRTVRSGQTATLSVVATGTTPLSYEWYQGASGDTSQPVGADANSFTTPALTVTTSYWVRVINSGGHADSTTATVSINPVVQRRIRRHLARTRV